MTHEVVAVRVHPHTRYWLYAQSGNWFDSDDPGVQQFWRLVPDGKAELIVDNTVPVHVFRLVDDEGWTKDETRATRYVVYRPAPGTRPGFLPERLHGLWDDIGSIPAPLLPAPPLVGATATGRATGRFEMRDHDGAIAEIYEVGP